MWTVDTVSSVTVVPVFELHVCSSLAVGVVWPRCGSDGPVYDFRWGQEIFFFLKTVSPHASCSIGTGADCPGGKVAGVWGSPPTFMQCRDSDCSCTAFMAWAATSSPISQPLHYWFVLMMFFRRCFWEILRVRVLDCFLSVCLHWRGVLKLRRPYWTFLTVAFAYAASRSRVP